MWLELSPRRGIRGRIRIRTPSRGWVSVVRDGKKRLALNVSFFAEYFARASHVRVFMNRGEKRLLVRPAYKPDRTTFVLHRRGGQVLVRCSAALKELRTAPGHYCAEWDGELRGLVIYLDRGDENA